MTDFELSLIAIGGTVVVGVFVYNKWQEYRAKKSVERAFSSTHDDVLMTPGVEPAVAGSGRHEPSFDSDQEPVDGDVSRQDGDIDLPAQTDQQEGEGDADDFAAAPPKKLPIDDMVDRIVPIALAAHVRGDRILHASQNAAATSATSRCISSACAKARVGKRSSRAACMSRCMPACSWPIAAAC